MTFEEFENKWFHKIVKSKNKYWKIPDKLYQVTAALYYDDNIIFAIIAEDYNLKNKHWFTIELKEEELSKLNEDFEIIQ